MLVRPNSNKALNLCQTQKLYYFVVVFLFIIQYIIDQINLKQDINLSYDAHLCKKVSQNFYE